MKPGNAVKLGFLSFGGALLVGAAVLMSPIGQSFLVATPEQTVASNPLPPVTVLDQAVQLPEQQYQAFTYDFPPSARMSGVQLSLELTHVGGTPMDMLVMDRTNVLRMQAGSEFSYHSELSRQSVQGQFVSRWFQPAEDGPIYIVLKPTNINDGNWTQSAARIVLKARA